jgi:hypothetical protein
VNDRSPKESHFEESHDEEKLRLRLSGHESQNPRFAPGGQAARNRQYPKLREALARYMRVGSDDQRDYPSDRIVVDVMDAAQPATEDEVIVCVRYLYEDRGLKPGTRTGPRHFSWFKTAVGDYFRQKRGWEQPATPTSASYGLDEGTFDRMTGTIELDAPEGT